MNVGAETMTWNRKFLFYTASMLYKKDPMLVFLSVCDEL